MESLVDGNRWMWWMSRYPPLSSYKESRESPSTPFGHQFQKLNPGYIHYIHHVHLCLYYQWVTLVLVEWSRKASGESVAPPETNFTSRFLPAALAVPWFRLRNPVPRIKSN